MKLPEELAPWAEELALFPRDVALCVGGWLPRLASAVGSFRAVVERGSGEPDGFDGITRHGLFDRLLLTEWLIAEEAPLEFVRRASTGELSFLALARSEPAGARRVVALFDVGPEQVGAPRIVQVAVLLVLARRAAAAGAELRFGALQSPAPLATGLSATTLQGLVEARDAFGFEPSQATGYGVRGPEAETIAHAQELWLVGGERLERVAERLAGSAAADLPPGTQVASVRVDEALFEADDPLRVTVQRRGRATVSLTLERPPEAVATRLLRAGFRRAPPKPCAPDVATPFRAQQVAFSVDGRRLLAISEIEGRVTAAAFHVPDSARCRPGRTRYLPPHPDLAIDRLLAVGFDHRSFVALLASDRGLCLQEKGRVVATGPACDESLTPLGGLWRTKHAELRYLVHTRSGRLLALRVVGGELTLHEVETAVTLLVPWYGAAVFLRSGAHPDGPRLGHWPEATPKELPRPPDGARAWAGFRSVSSSPLMGVEESPGSVRMLTEARELLSVEGGTTILGVVADPLAGGRPSLLVQRGDGRVRLESQAGPRALAFTREREVVSAAVGFRAPRVALLDDGGHVTVLDLRDGAVLLRTADPVRK